MSSIYKSILLLILLIYIYIQIIMSGRPGGLAGRGGGRPRDDRGYIRLQSRIVCYTMIYYTMLYYGIA